MGATSFIKSASERLTTAQNTRIADAATKVMNSKAAGTAATAAGKASQAKATMKARILKRALNYQSLFFTLLSRKYAYHGALNITYKTAHAVRKATVYCGHGVSLGFGTCGTAAANGVGYAFPEGGKFVQSMSNSSTGFITGITALVDDILKEVIDRSYSVAYSPTVTKAVTRTAKIISTLLLVELLSKGRGSALVSKVPYVGLPIAAVMKGTSVVWTIMKVTGGASVVWTLAVRRDEAFDVYHGRVTPEKFADEFLDEGFILKHIMSTIKQAKEELSKVTQEFGSEDATVSTDTAVAEEMLDDIKAAGDDSTVVVVDIATPDAWADTVVALKEAMEALDKGLLDGNALTWNSTEEWDAGPAKGDEPLAGASLNGSHGEDQ